ncbi:probable protein phosphatase 2C 37 [Triticum dicoccoides]|uniref:probable protein phosphatase 2C 37 n=1 Tax=Triticum dicoccoides TaxID=85692 RepID=UPI00162DA4AA|nr:probable protein phosphatase 2C 37 [Triticum dicoccoides]
MVMASAGVNNMPQGDSEEGRLRRRARLHARRYAHQASSAPAPGPAPAPEEGGEVQSPPPSSDSSSSSDSKEEESGCASDAVVAAAPQLLPSKDKDKDKDKSWWRWPVSFGSVALAGRLREMEDTVSLHPSLCAWADGSPMHLFAVFDGHGGPHAAALCREQMHVILAEELAGAAAAFKFNNRQSEQPAAAPSSSSSSSWEQQQREQEWEEQVAWRGALSRSFARADARAVSACACGRGSTASVPKSCSCLQSAAQKGAIVGSTAVVALLVRDRLIVANCGDSRAVLSRGGVAVPLSHDHKPDRPDEMARIKAAGGKVMYMNGARVRGILAMSRALGHRLLKPEVICEPEISITERCEDDDCLILASDGLWDVISNKVACDVARQCLEDGSPTRAPAAAGSSEAAPSSGGAAPVVSQEEEPRCFRAAALLARLALGRESSDNISVVVVDLKARG